MISEELHDYAALYVLGALDSSEAIAFESSLSTNTELRELVRQLRDAFGALAYAAPAVSPPAEMRARILRDVSAAAKITKLPVERRTQRTAWLPWAIAAGFVLFCGLLLLDRVRLARTINDLYQGKTLAENRLNTLMADRDAAVLGANKSGSEAQARITQLSAERDALAKKVTQLEEQENASRVEAAKLTADRDSLQQRVAELEQSAPILSQPTDNVQFTTLVSRMKLAPQARATVAWDAQKQEGSLRLIDVPPSGPDRDYQLWAIDPRYKNPVSAGIFHVESAGVSEITFRPVAPVAPSSAFAVSLERKGGSPKAQGPMVLVSK